MYVRVEAEAVSNPDPLTGGGKDCGTMQSLVAAHNWAATPLGPIEGWPQSLQTATTIVLTSRYAMWMGWGAELTFLYNDAYAGQTLGMKHPWALDQPWRRTDGPVEGVFVHAIDVTEGVQARETVERLASSVQESEAKLRAILQQVVSGICQVDRGQRFEYVNDRFGEIAGRSKENLDGGSLTDVVHPEDREPFERVFRAVLAGAGTLEVVHRWLRPDGRETWVQQNFSPVTGESGDIQSIVCVAQDITTRKLAEEALRKTEKLAAVGQLASSIAHEINNPLEAVTNLLYLIRGSKTMDESQRYSSMASEELSRVSHVATSTLRFHRQPSALSYEKVSVLLDSAVLLYKARLDSSGIELVREYAEVPQLLCFGSELRQVFSNLLGNAFDATRDADRRRICLRVQMSALAGHRRGIRVVVADTGRGMDPVTLQRAFEPFFTTKGIHGSGLGLWLSLEILNKHRARKRVRSRPGKGTVFSIFFPLEAGAAEANVRYPK